MQIRKMSSVTGVIRAVSAKKRPFEQPFLSTAVQASLASKTVPGRFLSKPYHLTLAIDRLRGEKTGRCVQVRCLLFSTLLRPCSKRTDRKRQRQRTPKKLCPSSWPEIYHGYLAGIFWQSEFLKTWCVFKIVSWKFRIPKIDFCIVFKLFLRVFALGFFFC